MLGDLNSRTRAGADPADDRHALPPRSALIERWVLLTRTVLPAMAADHGWPIRLDHCFMRVCLDTALGVRWDTVVRRPAIRRLSDAQLRQAVAQAEAIVADPKLLPGLNRDSLRLRGHPLG